MSERKPYLIEIYGITHTVLLSDEDAKKRGLTEPITATGTASAQVQDKMRTPQSSRRSPKDSKVVRDKAED